MAARQRKRRETHGKGLFFVTLCLLAAGVVKYSSFPAAAEFRARAAEALAGAPGMEEALGVFGGRTENAAAVSGDAGYAASSDVSRRSSRTRRTRPSIRSAFIMFSRRRARLHRLSVRG